MRGRTLLLLLGLALLQGGFLLRGGPATTSDPGAASRILQLDREQIDRIEIERRGLPLLRLSRQGTRWSLQQPLAEPADPDAVEAILSALEFLESQRRAPAQVSAAQLGLDGAALRLRLAAGPRLQELRLGAEDPSRQGVYLESGGARQVVSRSLREAVEVSADDLRDRSLLRLPREQLGRVQRGGPAPLILVRLGQGWTVQSGGIGFPAAPEPAGRLLGALLALRARRFLPAPPPGDSVPWEVVAGKQRVELRLGAGCPGHPGERSAAVRRQSGWIAVCVDEEELIPLQASPEELQDLRLTRLQEPELSRLELRRPGGSLVLRREAGLWQLPGGQPAELEEVRALLESLGSLPGKLQPRSSPASGSLGSLELHREAGGQELLRFDPVPGESGVLVHRPGMRGAALRVSESLRELLGISALRLRSRELLRFSPDQVRKLRWQGEVGSLELARGSTGWTVLQPKGRRLDGERLQALLEALSRLRAREYLPATGPRSLQRLELELEAEPGGSPRQHRLELDGAETGCLGRLQQGPLFRLADEDCRVLRRPVLQQR